MQMKCILHTQHIQLGKSNYPHKNLSNWHKLHVHFVYASTCVWGGGVQLSFVSVATACFLNQRPHTILLSCNARGVLTQNVHLNRSSFNNKNKYQSQLSKLEK